MEGLLFALSQPVLAAGFFGSIGMLLWATAAVVPLLIHFWNRRHHREAPFAAMEFLLSAVQEQSRRLRIEQLLLLLLRVAIPCFFAIALADPLWRLLPSQGSSLGTRLPHHHLFVVDVSYSMAFNSEGETRLEQSKELMRQIVSESPQGDGFTLVRMSGQSEPLISSPAFAKTDIYAEIDELKILDQEADLISALEAAKQILKTTNSGHSRLKRHRMYILSDFGRNTWDSVKEASERKLVGEIDELAEIVTVDTQGGESAHSNLALVSTARASVLPIRGSTMTWNVTARNWGTQAVDSVIELRLDDRLVAKEPVSLRPGQLGTATFQYQFDSAGEHVVSFHLPADSLLSDNDRFEIVKVREQVSVLCVEGRTGAARNVAIALAPRELGQIQVSTIRDHQLGNISLESYEAIYLCNVGSLTMQQATVLEDFVKQGRSLVFFLGDQSKAANLNELLFDRVRILPTKLLGLSEYATHVLSPLDYQHPLLQVFRGQEESGLLNTPIWTYRRVERPNSQEGTGLARIALEFGSGDPTIIEHSVMGGNVVVVTTAPSPLSLVEYGGVQKPWNAWNVWPSFPPLLQELLTFSVGELDERNNVQVNDILHGVLPYEDSTEYVILSEPNERERRIPVKEGSTVPSWTWSESGLRGVYSVRTVPVAVSSPVEDTHLEKFAVNIADYRESQLDSLSVDELPSQFQQHAIDVSLPAEARVETAPLFRQILAVVLVLLVVETMLAWYFGNARA